MALDSTVTLVGNLVGDPSIRFSDAGQARTYFSVAVNRRWLDKQSNRWEEHTTFYNVVCWGTLAENVADSLNKGSRVLVTGRLDQRTYEKDGQKSNITEIVADEVAPSLRWATVVVEKNERRVS